MGTGIAEGFIVDESFDTSGEFEDKVLQIQKRTFVDDRGYFRIDWAAGGANCGRFSDMGWVKQINTSVSIPKVFRGMHAQSGQSCQGKLVTCTDGFVYDLIIDARPESKTFMKAKEYILSASSGNAVWVPRGFLHGFCVAAGYATFMYMCDAKYDRDAEVCVDVSSVLDSELVDMTAASTVKRYLTYEIGAGTLRISEKDRSGMPISQFVEKYGKGWYR